MKTVAAVNKLWTCPGCGRKFEKQGQSHSCRLFPVEKHFEQKTKSKILYNRLKSELKTELGPFKTESLACCIHFVSNFTFAAVKIFRDKIKVDFSLSHPLKSSRVVQQIRMSAHRYLCSVEIYREDEIDEELKVWIREAHEIKKIRLNII